ncbi:hypothetical protein HBH82_178730 [Parastagonospora nodorum]|nr:hypothetical protein HBH82_178730 [Parastagonospora nodorum]KAH4677964.1 hypothetical protein HBH78_146180 [Parastagonospora nodorum]KAH4699950.1 hypothetical protein HBH67_153630 [Parastagonospora nodorum]KAH4769272.1 hypothetical protein HBH63_157550 [Parastagonospora nodorum]KAH4776229.1 hypothetical protein HBH62_171360 [Parastagonospora nodorum]
MPIFGRRHSKKGSKDASQQRDPPSSSRKEGKESKDPKEVRVVKESPPSSKHQRTKTAPDTPTLLRLPSASSTVSAAQRSRRASNPSTPTAPTPHSTSSATPASYFAPQTAASGAEPRSPATRRPPASFSAGHDTSRGPPVTLITRGNSDYARRTSQKPADFAYAQQQFQSLGLVSPGGSQSSSRRPRDDAENLSDSTPQPPQQQQQTHAPAQPKPDATATTATTATGTARTTQPMASSIDDSSSSESESDSGSPSNYEDRRRPAQNGRRATDTSGTDGEQNEDLFLNIAEDVAPPKQRQHVDSARHEKLRSRIARVNRMSSPSALQSPSPGPSTSTAPTVTRISSTTESRSNVQPRRSSLLPSASRTQQERPPQSPGTPLESPRTRPPELNSKASFSSRRDSDLSPRDFLAQLGNKRRGSQPEAVHTPPSRTGTYRPSNLGHYSSSRDDARAPQVEPVQREPSSHADGTESHGSTGPAVSVWDELDELKSRIRRIEMGGKIPSTSGAIVSQATAERPLTANTSATTVSSSPNQQRKSNLSPPESTIDGHTSSRTHPLLREALAKARQHTSPAVYRVLDATVGEALTLAEMTGSAGPQGTLHSASSILGGANVSDRQVRRKADNMCRSLTELCIALCETKTGVSSPAVRSSTHTISRRPSVQINGDSPTVRQSIEPESNTMSNVSPSRAMHRIEARRTSMLYNGNGIPRESSQDFDHERQFSSRLSRAGTSLHRNRSSVDDDDEDPIMRAPSRAMTDFRSLRPTEKSRLAARQYTSREPLPELQSPPSLQSSSSLRRPTATQNENSLLFRDNSRRYDFRESSPAYEKQVASTLRARTQLAVNRNPNNRNSIGGVSDLTNRNVTLGRRQRGNSTGE